MKEISQSQQEYILIAQDGSQNAQNASMIAIQIARARQYQVQGIYVVDEALVMEGGSDFHRETDSDPLRLSRKERAAQFETQGHEALQWLESHCLNANVAVSTAIALSSIPETVIDKMKNAQLLAIGSRGHGHSMLTDYLGSNFKAIAHKTKIPMLVGGNHLRPLHNVLLAYNGQPHAKEVLIWAERLQSISPAQVQVLTIEEEGKPERSKVWKKEIKQNLFQCGLGNCQFYLRKGQPASEIVAAATELQADLLIMGGYRHKALLEWLAGSTVDQVLRATELTCLVV